MIKFLISGLLVLSLMGCETQTVIKYETVPLNAHIVERTDPLVMKDVQFEVLEFDGNTILSMTFNDYENLSYNMNQIIAYIKSQIAVIEYYENMIISESINETD